MIFLAFLIPLELFALGLVVLTAATPWTAFGIHAVAFVLSGAATMVYCMTRGSG